MKSRSPTLSTYDTNAVLFGVYVIGYKVWGNGL